MNAMETPLEYETETAILRSRYYFDVSIANRPIVVKEWEGGSMTFMIFPTSWELAWSE